MKNSSSKGKESCDVVGELEATDSSTLHQEPSCLSIQSTGSEGGPVYLGWLREEEYGFLQCIAMNQMSSVLVMEVPVSWYRLEEASPLHFLDLGLPLTTSWVTKSTRQVGTLGAPPSKLWWPRDPSHAAQEASHNFTTIYQQARVNAFIRSVYVNTSKATQWCKYVHI